MRFALCFMLLSGICSTTWASWGSTDYESSFGNFKAEERFFVYGKESYSWKDNTISVFNQETLKKNDCYKVEYKEYIWFGNYVYIPKTPSRYISEVYSNATRSVPAVFKKRYAGISFAPEVIRFGSHLIENRLNPYSHDMLKEPSIRDFEYFVGNVKGEFAAFSNSHYFLASHEGVFSGNWVAYGNNQYLKSVLKNGKLMLEDLAGRYTVADLKTGRFEQMAVVSEDLTPLAKELSKENFGLRIYNLDQTDLMD